jgi:DNA-binding NarL/FixJ family response regulator
MKEKIKVLLVDDHPIIIAAYESAFQSISNEENGNLSFHIDSAENCDVAEIKIKEESFKMGIDIIFLDLRLPPSKDNKILSGEDLGILVKQLMPQTKIIVSTTFNDNYRIHSIIKNVNPDGFLIKNDITPEEIVIAIKNVLYDPPYYSKSVLRLLRKEVSNDFLLDDIDRRLLYELSLGTKMKDLPNILPLSIAGVEKRKRHLKDILSVNNSDDKQLIISAREKGFI